MRAGIFIASYEKDFPFLHGCLKSIDRFCHGFHRISVAVPDGDRYKLNKLLEEWGLADKVTVWAQHDAIPDGFMRAQYAMMKMDTYLWDCDFYFLVGSDCLFWNDVTPGHYLVQGKPVMLAESMADLEERGNETLCWKGGTVKATGIIPKHDYMRALPLIYTAPVLATARDLVCRHTKVSLPQYLQVRHPDFSESNIMGLAAWERCREEYHWCHDKLPMPMNLVQFWSWGGLDWKSDRGSLYNDSENKTQNTLDRTARDVTISVLGDIYGTREEGYIHEASPVGEAPATGVEEDSK